jgi:methanogenic corrinoid protein MtbC1
MARKEDLATLLAEFDEPAALRLVAQRLEAGEDPMALVDECNRGMRIIGERYQEGTYYISGLIMAGDLLRQILQILAPRITGEGGEKSVGTIVICTVQGDIHDIGKDIAANLLTAHGLKVVDLGVDVSPKRIADEVEAQRPDVVGLSGLLAGFEVMKRSVEAIRERTASAGDYIPIVLGGAPVTQKVCEYAGADGWCTDAVEGVRLVRELLSKKAGSPPPPKG